jgi:hypothetical protein
MSLLNALDFHFDTENVENSEVEYRLLSWGEIFSPFLGDREHSTAARFILREFPFKLFSASNPYTEIPQKLVLTFRAPLQTSVKGKVTSMNYKQDEIAKEFTAFLSVVTRRRVFVVGQTRYDGLPIEQAAELYDRSYSHERQQLKEIEPEKISRLLENLQKMNRELAQRFVLAIRLYYTAIQMMYSEPEFSYLFLVMSLEALSAEVYRDIRLVDEVDNQSDLEQHLDSSYPGWRDCCDISTPENREKTINMLVTKAYLNRRKFRKIVYEYLPESYWNEELDDAKPDYLNILIGVSKDGGGEIQTQPSDKSIHDYEKINRSNLKKILDGIYDARSKLVHEGVRLPSSIVLGHFKKIPGEALDEMWGLKLATKKSNGVLPIPPLITFERLTSYTLVEFLNRQRGR